MKKLTCILLVLCLLVIPCDTSYAALILKWDSDWHTASGADESSVSMYFVVDKKVRQAHLSSYMSDWSISISGEELLDSLPAWGSNCTFIGGYWKYNGFAFGWDRDAKFAYIPVCYDNGEWVIIPYLNISGALAKQIPGDFYTHGVFLSDSITVDSDGCTVMREGAQGNDIVEISDGVELKDLLASKGAYTNEYLTKILFLKYIIQSSTKGLSVAYQNEDLTMEFRTTDISKFLYELVPYFCDANTYLEVINNYMDGDYDKFGELMSVNSDGTVTVISAAESYRYIIDMIYDYYNVNNACYDALQKYIQDKKLADKQSVINSIKSEVYDTNTSPTVSKYYLALLHGDADKAELYKTADEQKDAIDNVTGDENASDLSSWYVVAQGVAAGNYNEVIEAIRGNDATVADELSDWENLLALSEASDATEEDKRKVYDILCLAYSHGLENPESAGLVIDGDSLLEKHTYLNRAFEQVKDNANGTGVLQNGLAIYESTLSHLTNLDSNSQTDDYKRMASFYDRMIGLYYVSTLNIPNGDESRYTWMDNYYNGAKITQTDASKQNEDYKKYTVVDASEVTTGEFLLAFNGDTGFPALNKDTQSLYSQLALPYMLQTIWELPYIRDYIIEDMNEALANNSILQMTDKWQALESIAKAVEEFNIPLLNRQWEKETTKNVTYKSLKTLYEACKNSSEIKDNTQQEVQELSTGKPLSDFFDYNNEVLSDFYRQGIAYTSTLVPMQSNLYSQEWLSYLDEDFKTKFYQLWGFNRKALFIDKTSGSAEAYFTSSSRASKNLKVCTLRDLLKCDKDIVLYIDDDLYNVEDIEAVIGKPTVSADAENWASSVANKLDEAFVSDIIQITKNGDSNNYSKAFYDYMSSVDNSHTYYPDATVDNPGNDDGFVLSSGKINYYLKQSEVGSEIYSPMQGYAVTSAVYRDGALFTKANMNNTKQPVFISSRKAPYLKNASQEAKQTIYNYMLLKNLKASMPVGYANSIDMSCTVYMDILGNIVTESGTVVVPAASNATLMGDYYYKTLWNVGLFSIYGNGFLLPVNNDNSIDSMLLTAFKKDNGKWVASPRTLGDNYMIDMSRLSTTNKNTLDIIRSRFYGDMENLEDDGYVFDKFFQICMEVLRGAPLENIDKSREELGSSGLVDKAGIIAAAKLEELNSQLNTGSQNTVLSIPNLAFMEGFDYIVLLLFKIILLAVLVINMITVYTDAVGARLGLVTAWKCLVSIVLTFTIITAIPTLFDITYYQSNRALLQDETAYISMLNLEKEQAGVEIGVTEIREPTSNTKLYVKLDDVEVKWYDLLYDVVFADINESLTTLYSGYVEDSLLSYEMDVEVKNDGIYVDVADIYDSSSIDLSVDENDRRNLKQTAKVKTNTFSRYSPYYAILDALIRNVNYYNDNPWGDDGDSSTRQGWYSYSIKTQKGGKLKTMGLIAPYFKSSSFMEDSSKDILGLYHIYEGYTKSNFTEDYALKNLYTVKNLSSMRSTAWFAKNLGGEEIQKRIIYLNNYARDFVAKNIEMLGKVSDETFLKVMALSVALKYNQTFGINCASSFEIYNLSEDDLIRLFIADTSNVMINSSLSYPRFVYQVGGTPTVFAGALLAMIMWLSSIVKPACVLITFAAIFISIFIFKICLKKEGSSLYGYILTVMLLSAINVLYSLLLKFSVYLPNVGLTPLMCVIVQIALQLAYMSILIGVVWVAVKDWRDLGFSRFANKITTSFMKSINSFYGGSFAISTPEQNWEYYNNMMDRRRSE